MQTRSIFIILACAVFAFVAFIFIADKFIYGGQAGKDKDGILKSKFKSKNVSKEKTVAKYLPIYKALYRVEGFRGILDYIRDTYAITLKGKEDFCKAKTAKFIVQFSFVVPITFMVATLVQDSILQGFIGAIVAVAFFLIKLLSSHINDRIILEEDLSDILVEFSGNYSASGNPLEALEEAAIKCNTSVKAHAMEIVKCLEDELTFGEYESSVLSDTDRLALAIMNYSRKANNSFIKRLFSLCSTSLMFGEAKKTGENTLLKGIVDLNNSIFKDTDYLKRRMLITNKRVIVTVIPLLFISFISDWGSKLLKGIEVYYSGIYALVYAIICIVTAIFSFYNVYKSCQIGTSFKPRSKMLIKLTPKFIHNYVSTYYYNHYAKFIKKKRELEEAGTKETPIDLVVKKMYTALIVFVILFILLFVGIKETRNLMAEDSSDITVVTANANKITKANALNVYLHVMHNNYEYYSVTLDELTLEYEEALPQVNKVLAPFLATSTYNKLHSINNMYVRWWYIILVGLASFGVTFIYDYQLKYRKSLVSRIYEEETIRLQGVIATLKDHSNMSISIILEWMEMFSEYFKDAIIEARAHINLGDGTDPYNRSANLDTEIEALNYLKERIAYKPFKRIITNLIMSDNYGISKAFASIEDDKFNAQMARDLQDVKELKRLEKKISSMELVTFYAVIVCYFLIPLGLYMAINGKAMLDIATEYVK